MAFSTNAKDLKFKEKQDKLLKQQLEKERQDALQTDIERTEKERIKKKGLKTLKQSGILDSYQYLLTSLCKYGLPTGDLYEFAALQVLRFEKKQKSLKKRELDDRLRRREDKKKEASLLVQHQLAAQKGSPRKKKGGKVAGIGILQSKESGLQEPNYDDIKLTPEQQSIIYDHIEQFWTEYTADGTPELTRDQAKEMLMKVSEDNFINQGVFDQTFVQDTQDGLQKPIELIAKEQMHQCAQIYILFMERQRTKEIYEAEIQLAQLNQEQQDDNMMPANMNSDMPPAEPAMNQDMTQQINQNQAASMANAQGISQAVGQQMPPENH